MQSLADFWLMLTGIMLRNFLVCSTLSTGQGDRCLQQNLCAATLFPKLKRFTSGVPGQSIGSMPGDIPGQTELTCKDIAPESWWSCASRCECLYIHMIYISLKWKTHYKKAFFRDAIGARHFSISEWFQHYCFSSYFSTWSCVN